MSDVPVAGGAAASTEATIVVEAPHPGVAVIELARPEALNAFTLPMARELLDRLRALADDAATRVVILVGSGRAFSAGADIKAVSPADRVPLPSGNPDLGWALREIYNPIVLALREMPQPVIAAVNGPAAGVGCSLALASDIAVAARSATFSLPFANIALVPDGGSSLLAAARAGLGRGTEMAMLGGRVDADRALEWGLVSRVVEDEGLREVALEIARRLAAGPPGGLRAIKALLNEPWLGALRRQLDAEAAAQTARSDSAEVVEAFGAFREGRRPVYAS